VKNIAAICLCLFVLWSTAVGRTDEVQALSARGFPVAASLPGLTTTPLFEELSGGWYGSDSSIIYRTPLYKPSFTGYKRSFIMDSTSTYFTVSLTHDGRPLGIPQVLTITDYIKEKQARTQRESFLKNVTRTLKRVASDQASGQSLELIGADIAGQRVSLRVRGNVNITGKLRNEDRSQQTNVNNQFQTNTFQIEQRQAFKIEGKIGDRISIQVDQDSERDFDFENNMEIYYNGNEDEIIQKIEAGNISLNLPGTKLAMFSGQNNGLFGLKAIMKVGALDITTIASLEKGRKEKKSLDGDSEEQTVEVQDWDWRRNTYFYLNDFYRHRAYPLNADGTFQLSDRQIMGIKVYKEVTNIINEDEDVYFAKVFEHPHLDSTHIESGYFKQLEQNIDYVLVESLGFIRMRVPVMENEILAVSYWDSVRTEPASNSPDIRVYEYDPEALELPRFQEGGDVALGIPTRSDTLELKMLKQRNPGPGSPAYDLEWKNVYSLRTTEINKDGFDLKIKYTVAGEPLEVADNGQNFLELFGLDYKSESEGGAPIPDGIIDMENSNVLDLTNGELLFPYLKPFTPDTTIDYGHEFFRDAQGNPFGIGGNPNLMDQPKYQSFTFYTERPNSQNHREDNKFGLFIKYSNRSSTFNLGFNVIENSEEVTLNSVPLKRGLDYNIDYFTGTLTILNESALAPGAALDIKYELHEFFNLDKKVILGSRAEYKFGQNKDSFIGLTALYFSKSSIDEKVRIGKEPIENFIWDVNTKMTYELPWLTKTLDWLPVVKTDAVSRINFQGEIAQVIPNPNTSDNEELGDKGVAYLDDFEGSRREAKINILRGGWRPSSVPVSRLSSLELDPNGLGNRARGYTYWFNPYNRVLTTQIWPNKEVSAQARNDVTDILILNVIPDSSYAVRDHGDPTELAWGGIMRALSSGYYDQTEAKFLEMWVRGETGTLHIDLGAISEDTQEPGETWSVWVDGNEIQKGYQTLDTEDLPFPTPPGDGFVEEKEDVGLDGWHFSHPDTLWQHPSWEFWEFDPTDNSEGIEYRYVNGSEGNMAGEGGRYPDTEDLNGNGATDALNAYFTISVDLSSRDYIAGETEKNGEKTGWKLIRVPLADFVPQGKSEQASWDQVKNARLWLDNLQAGRTSLQIATVDIVGNEWQELGIYSTYRGEEIAVQDSLHGTLNVSVINTEDNPDRYDAEHPDPRNYAAPPKGVEGILDPITRLRSKEQSLVIRADNLAPGHTVSSEKRFLDQKGKDLIHYETMKMFVHGWDHSWPGYEVENGFTPYVDASESGLEFFFRFGERDDIYYEVRQEVFPGWDERNHLVVDLPELANFKLSLIDTLFFDTTYVRRDENLVINDDGSGNTGDHGQLARPGPYIMVIDTLSWAELPENRKYANGHLPSGTEVAIRGNPSLSRIKLLKAGFRNTTEANMTGEIWMDELRLTDVEREVATAYRANMSLQLADLGSISMDVQRDDADFHNVQQQFGSGKNSVKTSISGSFNLNKLLPERWGLAIPLSASYRQSEDQPKYISGTDIKVAELAPSLRDTVESIKSTNQASNWNVSLSRRSKSDHWLPKYTIDAISMKLGASNSEGSSSTSLKQTSDKMDGNFSYSANLGKDFTVAPFAFMENLPLVGGKLAELEFGYLPSNIGFNASMAENKSYSLARVANATASQSHRLNMTRKVNVDWTLVQSMTAKYSANYNNNLDSLKNRKEDILKNADFGHLGSYNENYSLNWSPKVFKNVSPTMSYSSNFKASDNIDPTLPGLDLDVTSRSSASMSVKLTDVVDKVYTPEDKKKTETVDRGNRGRKTTIPKPDEKTEEEDEEQNPIIKALDFTYKTIDKITPVTISLSRNQSTRNQRQVAAIDTVVRDSLGIIPDTLLFREASISDISYGYRLGFTRSPDLLLHPSVTNPLNRGEDWSINMRSGINITKNLSSNFNFSFAMNQSERNVSQGIVESISQDYVPSGAMIGQPAEEERSLGRNGFTMPSFNLRYSGLNDIEWIKKTFSSAGLDMDFTGKKTIRSERGILTSEEYNTSINPRLNLQAKIPISASLSFRLARTISNTFSSENNGTSNQNYNFDVNASVSYQHRGGMTIPLPLMEDKYLDNNIDFRLEFSYTSAEQFKGNFDGAIVTFGEGIYNKTLSMKPTIGYSFTDKVSGNIGYQFQIFDDRTNGRRDVSDFSFGVNIQIKG